MSKEMFNFKITCKKCGSEAINIMYFPGNIPQASPDYAYFKVYCRKCGNKSVLANMEISISQIEKEKCGSGGGGTVSLTCKDCHFEEIIYDD